MNTKKSLLVVGALIIIAVLIVAIFAVKQGSQSSAGEEVDSGHVISDVQGPGKEDEIMSVIALDLGVKQTDIIYHQAFSSSQNERLVVVYGSAGFASPHNIAAFDVAAGNATLLDSRVGGVQGDLNHQHIGNVRWSDWYEYEISFDRFVVDESGINSTTQTVSVPWGSIRTCPTCGE